MTAVEVCPICDIAGCRHIRARQAIAADPMSDASVEAVARAFCKRMGLDPDERISSWDFERDKPSTVPKWFDLRDRAREAIAMSLALKEAP
jgi:hypothetical protein